MSFRKFGGTQYAPKNNIIGSYYNTSSNLQVTQNIGQNSSYIIASSDLSGNFFGNFTGDFSGSFSGNAINATNLLGGQAGSIPCQTNVNTTGFITPSFSNGQILTAQSNGIPTWAPPQWTTTTNGIYNNRGNVGIGTTPSTYYSLDISGGSYPLNITYNGNINTSAPDNAPPYAGDYGIQLTTGSTPNPHSGTAYITSPSLGIGIDLSSNPTNPIAMINFAGDHVFLPICLQTRGSNVGIGTINPSSTLDVSGNVTANTFNATSDYRIKENVKLLDDTYNINKLVPVTYLNKKTEKQDIGLIAHELQEVYPFLVTGEKDGPNMQTVNYMGLIGLLIKEIQDLKKEISIIKNIKMD